MGFLEIAWYYLPVTYEIISVEDLYKKLNCFFTLLNQNLLVCVSKQTKQKWLNLNQIISVLPLFHRNVPQHIDFVLLLKLCAEMDFNQPVTREYTADYKSCKSYCKIFKLICVMPRFRCRRIDKHNFLN